MMEDTIKQALRLSQTLGERVSVAKAQNERSFTSAIIERMAADRLLWVLAPQRYGGADASIRDTANLVSNVARISGSAGLIYAMHLSQVLTVVRHAEHSTYLNDMLRRFVQRQSLIASGTSEVGVGGDIYGSKCVVEQTECERFFVTKQSPNISYLDMASALLITANQKADGKKPVQILFLAERENTKVEIGPEVGFMGMRGILNAPYKIHAKFDREAIFSADYPTIARQTMTPSIHIFWAALWSGIAGAAVQKVKQYLAKETARDPEVHGHVQTGLSLLVDKHYTMNALIRDAIVEFEAAADTESFGFLSSSRIARLKSQVSALLVEICIDALGLVGLRGYAEAGPYSLSEIVRDALSSPIMVSNHRLLLGNARIERFVEEGI